MGKGDGAERSMFEGHTVTGELGTGAFCVVVRARSTRLGREVAVKALRSGIPDGSPFAAQLAHEAAILGQLAHPNIVLLLDRVPQGAGACLVLELVEGPSLAQLLARRPRLSPELVAWIGAAVARALAHAHERGVVHRDIKPGNVLLSRTGQVKLIDFGIALQKGAPGNDRPVAWEPQSALGTLAYASPEQILGEPADERSDLFALGALLYEATTGRHPFGVESAEDRRAAYRVRRAVQEPLRRLAPNAPRSLEALLSRLLEKHPGDRPESAGLVADKLERIARERSAAPATSLVRRALLDAGFSADPAPPLYADEARRRPSRVRATLVHLALVGAATMAAGAVVELTGSRVREGAGAGQPLALVPASAGGLRVLATPWAAVFVDGQQVDVTPFARAIPLSPGSHSVALVHPAAKREERTIVVRAGETLVLDVVMDTPPDPALLPEPPAPSAPPSSTPPPLSASAQGTAP